MKTTIGKMPDPMNRLAAFVLERHRIYMRRFKNHKEKPWTDDPILQSYRFCNVYRELDAVTIWIRDHWRNPHGRDPLLWFAMAVARLFNNPHTLVTISYPVPWKERTVQHALHRLQRGDIPVFNAAYIVSTNGIAVDKVDYIVQAVLTPMWLVRARLCKVIMAKGITLESAHAALQDCNGFGGRFMAAQVLADLKNTPGQPLAVAKDWYSWASIGPGSKRGLNRVMERDLHARVPAEQSQKELWDIQRRLSTMMVKNGFPRLCAQDTQNCLCEFDKYERALHNEGRPKQLYPGV